MPQVALLPLCKTPGMLLKSGPQQAVAELRWQAQQSTVMWSRNARCRVRVLECNSHTAGSRPMMLHGQAVRRGRCEKVTLLMTQHSAAPLATRRLHMYMYQLCACAIRLRK